MLAPATTQVLEDHGYVTEDDEGWGKDWALVKGHDQLVTLELPNLVGDGLHLEECIAIMTHNNNQKYKMHRETKKGSKIIVTSVFFNSNQLFSCGLEEHMRININATAETNNYNGIRTAIQWCLPLYTGNYPDRRGLFSTLTHHQHGNGFANEAP